MSSGSAQENVKAGLAARGLALAIDWSLITLGHWGLYLLLVTGLGGQVARNPLGIIIALLLTGPLFVLAYLVLHLAYFSIFHALGGQTPGKLALGIRVVSGRGGPLSPGQAFLRWTGYLVSFFPLGAGFLWAALDKEHRAWHDLIADTSVVALRHHPGRVQGAAPSAFPP